jgi:hypothetical protein
LTATLGSFCGKVLVETWTSSPEANETNWFEDPVTCWSAMRTPDDSTLLNCPPVLAGRTGRTRGSMVVPTRRMKSTGTALLRDNSATRTVSAARAQKRCCENGRLSVWVAPTCRIAWDNPIIPEVERCSSMILKSQIFTPNRVRN